MRWIAPWLLALLAWAPLACRQRAGDGSTDRRARSTDRSEVPGKRPGEPRPRSAPNPRPQPSPPVAAPSAFDLPDAKGVTPLDLKAAAKLPELKVPLSEVVAHARRACNTQWYGLYLQNQKVGWGEASCGFQRQGEREVLYEKTELLMRVRSFGSTEEMRIQVESRYSLEGPVAGELLRYEMRQKTAREEQHLLVERRAEGWHARRTYQGGKVRKAPTTQVLKAIRSGLGNGERAWAAALAAGTLPVGKRARFLSFDDEDLKDQESGLQVLASAERQLQGVTIKLHKVETLSLKDKVRGVGVHDTQGDLLEGTFQRVMRIRREEKATAKTLAGKATDFGVGLVIRAPMRLERPGQVRRMKVRLQGFLPEPLATHPRHALKTLAPQDVELTVTRERLEGASPVAVPVREPGLAEHLKATHNIEVGDPRIKALARRALGDAKDTLAAARRLTRFVYGYLRKDLTTNLDSAVAILQAKAGDCTEHARLLVALCRAVGLPAREVGGVTWVPDLGGFGYHAWVEVYLGGGRWVSADPAWDELPANATHIFMGGPDDGRWIGTLGALSARVMDAEQHLADGSVRHVRGEEDGGIDEDEDADDSGGAGSARRADPRRADARRSGTDPRRTDPRRTGARQAGAPRARGKARGTVGAPRERGAAPVTPRGATPGATTSPGPR